MNLKIILILAAVLCLSYSGLRADSHWNLSLEDNQSDGEYDSRVQDSIARADYKRNVLIGYFMAIVPGFFVHGAGNYYAGNAKRGTAILFIGALSTAGFIYGGIAGAGGEGEMTTFGKIWMVTSITVFFGTWFWDIMTVQDSIEDRCQPQAHVSIGPIPLFDANDNDPALGVSLSIRF